VSHTSKTAKNSKKCDITHHHFAHVSLWGLTIHTLVLTLYLQMISRYWWRNASGSKCWPY